MRNHKERVSSTDSDIPRDTPYRRRPSWHPQTLNNQHLTLDLVPLCCGKGVETRWDGAGEACILTRGRETTVVKNLPAYAGAPSQVLHVSDARAAARWCLDFSREFHPVLCLETWVCPACNEPADVARMWHNRPICLPPSSPSGHPGDQSVPSASTVPDFQLPSAGPCRTSNTGPDRLRSIRLVPSHRQVSLPPMNKVP
jgi:hypothetical protein